VRKMVPARAGLVLVAMLLSASSPDALADKAKQTDVAADPARESSPREAHRPPKVLSPANKASSSTTPEGNGLRPSGEGLEPPRFSDGSSSLDAGAAAAVAETVAETVGLAPPKQHAPPTVVRAPIPGTTAERPVFAVPPKIDLVSDEDLPAHATPSKEATAVRPPSPVPPAASDRRAPPVAEGPDGGAADPEVDVLTLIRLEIKQRLPYFQSCARSARRRGGVDIRRVQATWSIAADGAIKKIELDGVDDPQLATCIVRAGSRRFAVAPGVDLVVPTPIVFVLTPSESVEP